MFKMVQKMKNSGLETIAGLTPTLNLRIRVMRSVLEYYPQDPATGLWRFSSDVDSDGHKMKNKGPSSQKTTLIPKWTIKLVHTLTRSYLIYSSLHRHGIPFPLRNDDRAKCGIRHR